MVKTEGMSDSTENVDDLRGRPGSRAGGFGGGIPIPGGAAAKLGIPGVVLAVLGVVLGLVFTGGGGGGFGNVTTGLSGQEQPAGSGSGVEGAPLAEDDPAQFTVRIFNDTQAFWEQYFAGTSVQWRDARLSPFTSAVDSACGGATSASGPFYCPGDEHVYIDLDFFDEMTTRFNAPGDFAQAYVIAHEVGHHVQNVTGIEARVRQEQQRTGEVNALSVRLELQADCFAGVWAYSVYSHQLLETGDLEEALGAASAVGDDRLQKQATGRVNPDTFTHGTSEQRSRWFRTGFESGDPDQCDTYSGDI